MLAEAEAKDNGKPVSLASHVDIPRAEKNLRFYASGISITRARATPWTEKPSTTPCASR
jgi:acyl-CoA reductase-like NAD-dependent aldehyde dehydrogenase